MMYKSLFCIWVGEIKATQAFPMGYVEPSVEQERDSIIPNYRAM